MDNYGVILAIIAVLSLAVQGLVKAIDIMKKKKNGDSFPPPHQKLPEKFNREWDQLYDWNKEMYSLHDRRDPITGVPVWYVTKDTEQILKDHANSLRIISESYVAQTEILRNQQEIMKEILSKVNLTRSSQQSIHD